MVTVIWQQNSREMPRDEWLKSGHAVVLNSEFPRKGENDTLSRLF